MLDIVATNFNDLLVEAGVTDPVENERGVLSDHGVVYTNFKMPRVPTYRRETYGYFHITEDGKKNFGKWITEQEWTAVTDKRSPSEKVRALHSLFNKGMKHCFEWKIRTKKSSEPPWMTGWLAKMIARRRAIFRKSGRRCLAWRTLSKKIRRIIKKRKDKYFESVRNKFLNEGDSKNFHYCVKTLLQGGNKKPKWSVSELYPDKTSKETAEALADYFNAISQEYAPLEAHQIPTTFDTVLPLLSDRDVEERLLKCR